VSVNIIGWIVIGAACGVLADRLVPAGFPGGVRGSVLGGMAGAFIGGGGFSLVANRGVSDLDLLNLISLIMAFIGAALLLTAIRKASYVEPHPPERIDGSPNRHSIRPEP
jgi:uncharacterized membrane protein YeaQ/YmgE (transglycosylase-associated protein family)